jgi:flagellar motor switch protein FliN/FliY
MAGDEEKVSQDEIEALLNQAKGGGGASAPPSAAAKQAAEDADKILGQSEIEAMLASKKSPAPTAARPAAATATATAAAASPGQIAPGDVELLLRQAEQALASIDAVGPSLPTGATSFKFEEFAGAPPNGEMATLDLLRDVELDLKIELGRTQMYLDDVLRMRKGSVVALDKLAGDPVDIYVNGRLIARGEVLVMNDNFCVRVAELVAGEAAA